MTLSMPSLLALVAPPSNAQRTASVGEGLSFEGAFQAEVEDAEASLMAPIVLPDPQAALPPTPRASAPIAPAISTAAPHAPALLSVAPQAPAVSTSALQAPAALSVAPQVPADRSPAPSTPAPNADLPAAKLSVPPRAAASEASASADSPLIRWTTQTKTAHAALWRELSAPQATHQNLDVAMEGAEVPLTEAATLPAAEELKGPPARSSAALGNSPSTTVVAPIASAEGGAMADTASDGSSSNGTPADDPAPTPDVEFDALSASLTKKASQTTARVEVDAHLAIEVGAGDAGVEVTLEGTRATLDDLRGVGADIESALERDGERLAQLNYRDKQHDAERRAAAKAWQQRSSASDGETESDDNAIRPAVQHGALINAVA